MCKYADVAAAADGDAGLHGEPEGIGGLLHVCGWRLAGLPAFEVFGISCFRFERRHVSNVVLLHQFEHFACATVGVFDGVDAREDGTTHAFGCRGVHGDWQAERVGGFHAGVEFFLREGGYGAAAFAAVVVGVELDPVRAVTGLVAYGVDHLCSAADRYATLRNIQVGAKAHRARSVAMAGDSGAGGDE